MFWIRLDVFLRTVVECSVFGFLRSSQHTPTVGRRTCVFPLYQAVESSWIRSSVAIEAWAFYMAIMHATPGCSYRIDNKMCVETFHRGEDNIPTRDRPVAWLWKLIFGAINDEKEAMDVAWMPAHTKQAQIANVKLGNGEILTAANRRGNATADALAKIAANKHGNVKDIYSQGQEFERAVRTVTIPAIMLRSAAQINAVRCKYKPKPSHVDSQRRKRQSWRTPCLERGSCTAGCAGK